MITCLNSKISLTALTLGFLSFISSSFESFGIDLKRFDAPEPQRVSYLSFKSPPRLRYTPLPSAVDRTKLIMLDITFQADPSKQEDNSTESPPDFPIVEYSPDNEASSVKIRPQIPQAAPTSSLPLADPFEGVNETNVGTTDELLDVFDQMRIAPQSANLNQIPFIPPYTIAPDNMRIETKSSYRRVQR